MPRGNSLFQVIECINDNAYKLKLPSEFGISTTFNVSHLSPFNVGDELELRPITFQDEGNDESIRANIKYPRITKGPLTRAKAKKLKDSMIMLVKEI